MSEDGLFQFGYSKDRRPDLPQLKVMLSALDPLGLPVATQIVLGQRTTSRPTAEALLAAFKPIHVSFIILGQLYRHLIPLSALQQHILSLLDFSPELYNQLCAQFPKPT